MRSFFRKGKGGKAGWLAIVPGARRIDLAHVVREAGRRPHIRMLESFAAEGGAGGSLGNALKRLSAFRPAAHRCTTLLQSGQYYLSQFEAPPVPAEERQAALRWRFKDMVDFPLGNASIDVFDIPTEGIANRQAMVYAVAAGADVVWRTMQQFDAAKVPLAAIDIPELAQRNVAALFEEENRGLAFLSLDDEGGLLTVTWRGELYAMRRTDISARQLAGADEESRHTLLERLALDLQRTLDNFDRQYSFISVSGMVVAASAEVPGLQACLAENVYIPVSMMDLAQVCDFPDLPRLREPLLQAQSLPAIGAALRSQGAA